MLFNFFQSIYALTVAQAPSLQEGFKRTDSVSFVQSLHNTSITILKSQINSQTILKSNSLFVVQNLKMALKEGKI